MTTHSHEEHTQGDAHHHAHGAVPSAGNPPILKDPVCGMTVTAKSQHHSDHMGRSFFFCGPKCKTKFDANPMQYMGAPTDTPPSHAEAVPALAGTVYTCPMHPEVRQDHPGNCPKCGMTLEPVMPTL